MKKRFKKRISFAILLLIILIIVQIPAFTQLGMSPDSTKTHTLKEEDALYDLGLEYYNAEERQKGAHWIHIYEYSAEKGYIDKEKQPILPYKDDAKVIVYSGNKVEIPFFDSKYPDANTLLNKYGFELDENGYSVSYIGLEGDEVVEEAEDDGRIKVEDESEDVITGLPIDIDKEEEDETAMITETEEQKPKWIGDYQASPNMYLKGLSSDYDELVEQIREFFNNYSITLNEGNTLTAVMYDQTITGTVEENPDGTLRLTFEGLILPGTEGMEFNASEPQNITITVEPMYINNQTYFIIETMEDKPIIFSSGGEPYWVGTYEADYESYFDSQDIQITDDEKNAMLESLEDEIGGHIIRLNSDYTVETSMGGAMIERIELNNDGSLNINLYSIEKKTITPQIEDGEIFFTIPAKEGEIKFVKVD